MKPILYGIFAVASLFAQPGTISTIMGANPDGFSGPALDAAFLFPFGIAVDAPGNVYFAAVTRILRVGVDQRITVFAGNGTGGFSGDGGSALNAGLVARGLAFDTQGNLVLADFNARIRRITPDGIIRTIAGTGAGGFAGDGGPALNARLSSPAAVAFDSLGNLYIADTGNHRIRKVDRNDQITTFAGDGVAAFRGDSGPALQASFNQPESIVFDSADNLYVADSFNRVIRKITPAGIVSTIAGRNQPDSPQTDPQGAPVFWTFLTALAIDKADNLYFGVSAADTGVVIGGAGYALKRDPAGKITFIAGSGGIQVGEYSGPALGAGIMSPSGRDHWTRHWGHCRRWHGVLGEVRP